MLSFLQASEVFVSADILAKMMEFEWIDDLTSDVFVASFIYFPNADAISLRLAKYVAHNLQISPLAMQHGHVLPFNAILCWNPPRMRMNFLFADTGRILSETVIDTHSVLQARHDKTTGQMDSPLDFLYFLPQRFPENGLKRLDLPA